MAARKVLSANRLRGFIRESKRNRNEAPGTLTHIGERYSDHTDLRLIAYTPAQHADQCFSRVDEALQAMAPRAAGGEGVMWLNANGLHEVGVIQAIGEFFELHPLVLEDILDTEQAIKVEEDPDGRLFIVLKMIKPNLEEAQVTVEQVSVVVGANYILTFQERPGDVFEPLRQRIAMEGTPVRMGDVEVLAHRILDAIGDNYIEALDLIAEQVERAELQLLNKRSDFQVNQLYTLKAELLYVQRGIRPLRDILNRLERSENFFLDEQDFRLLHDVRDTTQQAMERVDTYQQILNSLLDLYHSTAAAATNRVVGVLTIISTIFLPLTFLTGLYGMNLINMPETNWPWFYPALLGFMGVVAGGMLVLFKRKGWL